MLKLALTAACLAATPAAATTARDLMASCRAVPDAAVGARVSLPPEALPCWLYVGALTDLLGVADRPGVTVLGACGAEAAAPAQVARLFVRYAERHPEVLDQRAALGALLAVREAWPCR